MAAGRCKAAYYTDEWHGYGCNITEGACMFLVPDSKNAQICMEKDQMQNRIMKLRRSDI